MSAALLAACGDAAEDPRPDGSSVGSSGTGGNGGSGGNGGNGGDASAAGSGGLGGAGGGAPLPPDPAAPLFAGTSIPRFEITLSQASIEELNAAPDEYVPGELTVTQYRLLAVVVAQGPLTISDVAGLLGVAQSNATRLCDRLQRLRYLERSRSVDDRRVVRVDVTAAGRDVVDVATEARRRQIRLVLASMSAPARRRALAGVAEFNRAAGALEEHPWLRAAWCTSWRS